MNEIVIPQMGESITEVQIGQLLVKPEAFVKEGDEVVEIETEKVNQLLYAPKSGTISWKVKTGDTVKVGAVVATISEATATLEPPALMDAPMDAPIKEEPPPITPIASARKEAADFLKEIEIPFEKPEALVKPTLNKIEVGEERRPMSAIRLAISERLVRAKSETAMLTTFNEVDMTRVMEAREKYGELFKKKYGVKLGFLSFFVKAVLSALRQYPIVGSMIEGKEVVKKEPLDIGVAVSTDRGLVVPVLRNPEVLTFSEIESAIELLAKKAREGGLTVDDLRGGVFTITNGGIFGSLLSTPIVNYPQSAILGLHKIEKRPVAIQDEVKIRSMMYLAMSYDHRLIDGREAVQFLVRIKELLEEPERLLFQI